MTIEEKLQLTIYEAEDAGIITESEKDEMISFIEEKRRDSARITDNFNRAYDDVWDQIDMIDEQINEEREKRRQIRKQLRDLDSSSYAGPEGRRLGDQLKASDDRCRRLYDKRRPLDLKRKKLEENESKDRTALASKNAANKKHDQIMQIANTTYGNKK